MIVSNELLMQTILGLGEELTRIREAVRGIESAKPDNTVDPIYMSATQACERYGISRETVYEIMRLTDAPQTLKVGSRRLLPIKDYDAFMRSQFGERN